MRAIERVTANPELHTPDLGGKATTQQVTDAVIGRLLLITPRRTNRNGSPRKFRADWSGRSPNPHWTGRGTTRYRGVNGMANCAHGAEPEERG